MQKESPIEIPRSAFNKASKPKVVEELIDFYFHRRLAVPIVSLAARIGLSPNQVTFLSLLSGLTSAFCFAKNSFALGGVFLLGAIVLDCADGMLARLTGKSSPIGRILDGVFDHVWIVLIWVYIYLSVRFYHISEVVLPLEIMAGASMFLHCGTYDNVKTAYLTLCDPDFSEQAISFAVAKQKMMEGFRERRIIEGVLHALLAAHQTVFGHRAQKSITLPPQARQHASNRLFLPIRLWSFLGEGTHLGLMVAAALLTPFYSNAMLIAFSIMLVPMNILWVVAGLLWLRRKREVLTRNSA